MPILNPAGNKVGYLQSQKMTLEIHPSVHRQKKILLNSAILGMLPKQFSLKKILEQKNALGLWGRFTLEQAYDGRVALRSFNKLG